VVGNRRIAGCGWGSNDSSGSGRGVLAKTGDNVIGVAGLGAAIAAGGIGLVLITRRRREAQQEA
jgi:LPXTG-motif cell wall-anchored protein